MDTLDRAKGWMEAVLAWRHSYGEDAEARAAAIEATRQLEPLLLDTVRARRDRPQDDAISLLWRSGPRGRARLDRAGRRGQREVHVRGSLRNDRLPHLQRRIPPVRLTAADRASTLGDPDVFALFLEEVLRHSTVIHIRARRATADVDLGGARIRAGERVFAVNAAANRDPERWERPADVDPSRARLFGHLAFNVGPRHCAGSHSRGWRRLRSSWACSGRSRTSHRRLARWMPYRWAS